MKTTLGYALTTVAVLLVVICGTVAAAGTTEVRLSPEAETADSGETVTYDIVVGDASGGIGSYNVTVSTNDSAVASIQSVSASGSPAYADQSGGSEARTLTVSGMDTVQSGPVTVATVTVAAQADGTIGLAVSVTALGDEEGQPYTVTATQGRSLRVVGSSGGDSGGSEDSGTDDSDSGGEVYPGGSDTPTRTHTATPTPTETATESQTMTATETATAPMTEGVPSQSPPSTETATSTDSATGGTEPSSSLLTPLITMGVPGIVLAGLLYYGRT